MPGYGFAIMCCHDCALPIVIIVVIFSWFKFAKTPFLRAGSNKIWVSVQVFFRPHPVNEVRLIVVALST